jgi:DNA-binding NarL/FixJ family response regulator
MMAARNEAVNPLDVRLKTASGARLAVSVAVVAVRDNGRRRPAILHLLRPMERAVDEKGRSQNDRSIGHRREAPAEEPPCADGNGFKPLTGREQEILAMLAKGVNCHDMARATGISLTTVRNHLKRIFPKLRVHSQAEAVAFAFRRKMVSLVGFFLIITSDAFLDQFDAACDAVGMLLT